MGVGRDGSSAADSERDGRRKEFSTTDRERDGTL